ncbi:uncharacterized protein AB675_11540 [Cyphellophora attinorum]|uniref:Fungal N-terminal domain-containing protein n=1 Tax=Cyphellophora attinorum TaxID=1664694 RepID=A0A0N1H482_9EURO|nr:uncharacterized protein AB675_11540 [Phialophora attinorum]KPI39970.1 hypothetical protein AB675_11540 [Phialophora attinorum]
MEIAGLAIGVVPLIAEAVKSYKSTKVFIMSFKHFRKHMQKIIDILDRQEFKFRKAIECVLLQCVDQQLAREMLQDPGHSCWLDKVVTDAYLAFLGPDHDGFSRAACSTCDSLEDIGRALRILAETTGRGMNIVTAKAHFAIERSSIEARIGNLRQQVDEFVGITNMLVTASHPVELVTTAPRIISNLKREVQRFVIVKKTAEDLHTALITRTPTALRPKETASGSQLSHL